MSEAGVVRRSRQLCGDLAERLRSHGIELVPFLTVGCLVAAFWCALSIPALLHATEPARTPVASGNVRPVVQLRVIASSRGATMPELLRSWPVNGPTKGSRARGETPVPAMLFVASR